MRVIRKFNKAGAINYRLVLISAVLIGGLILAATLMQRYSENPVPAGKPEITSGSPSGISHIQADPRGILFGAENKDSNRTAGNSTEPEKSVGRIKNYINGLKEKGNFFKEKIDLLNSLLQAKEREVTQLTEINLRLKEDLNKATQAEQEEKTDLQKRFDNLSTQFTTKETEAANLNNLKLNLENQVRDLNNKLGVLSTTYSALEGQFNQIKQEKSVLEAELTKFKEDLKRQTLINETLNKDLVELNDDLKDKEKQRQGVVQELEQLISLKKKMECELGELKIIKSDNEKKLAELDSQIKELKRLYEEAKNSVSQMSELMSKKDLDIAARQNDISRLQDNFYKATSEKDAFFLSLQEREKGTRDLEEKLGDMGSRILQFQRQLCLEQERRIEGEKKLEQAKLINTSLKNRLKNIYMELEFMRATRGR
jgi:nucleoprotein TPR